jgi:hypothetical protein
MRYDLANFTAGQAASAGTYRPLAAGFQVLPIVNTVVSEAKPKRGSSISVRNEGTFNIAAAMIAVAQSSEVIIAIVLIFVI